MDLEQRINQRTELRKLLIPRPAHFCPHKPTSKQAAFLLMNRMEVLYGGAAGGGKSEALLMAALQWIDQPDYAALILRRSLTDLALPGAIMDRSHEWLTNSPAKWIATLRTWRFPSGASVCFGFLDRPEVRFRYQSTEFQFIGFDELTQFGELEYTYLLSRLRRKAGSRIPLRMRSASNPGGFGHNWVKRRFIDQPEDRLFIPATIRDNPHLDSEEYVKSLNQLDPITKAQLLTGDWDAADDGIISWTSIEKCLTDCLWNDKLRGPPAEAETYLGVDIGRTNDPSVIWTWERLGDVLWTREVFRMEKTSFREQAHEIRRRITKGTVRVLIDKGSIGYQLAEELEAEYPGIVKGLVLTPGTGGRIATRLAIACNEGKVRIPNDHGIIADFRAVRRTENVGGLETHRTEDGHADRFWAAALGVEAAMTTRKVIASSPRARKWQSFRSNR